MSPRIGVRRLARLVLGLGLLLMVLAPATVAWAQTGGGNGDYPVVSTSTTNPCADGRCATSTTISVKGESTLPFTGGDVALVTILGLAAAGSGAFLVWLGRRSSAAS